MNYLVVDYLPNEIKVKKVEQEVENESASFSLQPENIEESLAEVADLLKDKYPNLAGGVIDGTFSSRFSETILSHSEGQTIDLSRFLSEKLDYPFISAKERDQYETLQAAFDAKADQLVWQLEYDGFQAGKKEYSTESLLTIGNGFMGIRGTTPEMQISEATYPATYLASGYNRAESEVAGRMVTNEDLVNQASAQFIVVELDGELLIPDETNIRELKRTLNLKNGLLHVALILASPSGKLVELISERIVNMAVMEETVTRYRIRPLNFSGTVKLVTTLDGTIRNFNVARYRTLNQHHFSVIARKTSKRRAMMRTRLLSTGIEVLTRTQLTVPEGLDVSDEEQLEPDKITQKVAFQAEQENCYTFEKRVLIHASHTLVKPSLDVLQNELLTEKTFAKSLAESQAAFEKLWQTADIKVTGDLMSQKMLRLHTYHLLISASPLHSQHLDASITARGLHGEAYRGHIFWDEIFILPFYIYHFPDAAKDLLMYRYRRLDAAREEAKRAGYQGAMFPWQSGHDGTEETQLLHINPLNGEWDEDRSRLQRHVSLAVAYNVWLYFKNTNDRAFMETYGLEMLFSIAQFWKSLAVLDETTGRYHIEGVMGPDEFHEAYPNSEVGGLKDNAYTNMMVVWLFEEIAYFLSIFDPAVIEANRIKADVVEQDFVIYDKMKHQLYLEISEDDIIAQYQGFLDLKEIDWDGYREKYGNIYRMDRILKAEGESADDYQVMKQADTLMTFYNLTKDRADQILTDLGYKLREDYLAKNLAYYLKRTTHGSTLSRIVHAELAEIAGEKALAWQLYQEALYSDYADIQGGTTAEGIHTGVMAATLDVTLRTFAGIDYRGEWLSVMPNLPAHWQEITFSMSREGVHFSFVLTHQAVTVLADQAASIEICAQHYQLEAGKKMTIHYEKQ
ncbi:glycoside hydrolase family 65 protein [Listeria costaricensis]|uniref:glycoside hydrolase family 65 protein n=1 Tax=Listeria costaricensis TaxID=2026604 RepID=UPI000C06E26B|nr:glycosyl hydrolase family 65 protein [Listeria costaricensis]